jgi:hypothetical protein
MGRVEEEGEDREGRGVKEASGGGGGVAAYEQTGRGGVSVYALRGRVHGGADMCM